MAPGCYVVPWTRFNPAQDYWAGFMASRGEAADRNQPNMSHLNLPFKACRRASSGCKTCKKCKRRSLEPVFGLSVQL